MMRKQVLERSDRPCPDCEAFIAMTLTLADKHRDASVEYECGQCGAEVAIKWGAEAAQRDGTQT